MSRHHEERLLEVLRGALEQGGWSPERERKIRCAITATKGGLNWLAGTRTWYGTAWYMGIKLEIYPSADAKSWSVNVENGAGETTYLHGFFRQDDAKFEAMERVIALGVQP